MNKIFAFVAVCILASTSASIYGGHHAVAPYSAQSVGLAYLQSPSYSVVPNYSAGIGYNDEPSILIPNIIAPSYGAPIQSYGTPIQSYGAPIQSYGAPVAVAPQYAASSYNAGPAAVAPQYAAPSYNSHARALAPATSYSTGVARSSISSSSHSEIPRPNPNGQYASY